MYQFTPTEMLGYLPAFADYVSDGHWFLYPHLLPIVDALEDVARGKCRRLAVFLPPRHGKSTTISQIFPAWMVCRDPRKRVIIAGYGKDFATKWGRATRNIVSAYGKAFGISIDPSSKAKDHWETTEGGGVHCCGTGSAVTGYGGDCFAAGTMVRTPSGPRAIESLKPNDIVTCFDHRRGVVVCSRVVATRRVWVDSIYEVRLRSGRVLRATGDHPFFVVGRGYTAASRLRSGDPLLTLALPLQASQLEGDSVSVVTCVRESGQYVYDIQVAGCHNFFAEDVLVHNCIIIDDPIKGYEQAHSQIERDNCWNWLTSDLLTRQEPGASVIMVLTRWHLDDVAGRMLENARETGEQWRVIKMPAIATQDEDWGYFQRKKGEALCPQRYDLESLEQLKSTLGPYKWNCLFQQEPTTAEGSFWPSSVFDNVLISQPPRAVEYPVMAIDPSMGRARKDKILGDYTAVVALGVNPTSTGRFYCDSIIDRMRPEHVVRAVADLYHKFPTKPKKIGVEAIGFQAVLETRFRTDLPKYGVFAPVVPLEDHIQYSKDLRIKEMDGWISNRQIDFLDTPGGRMMVNQLKNFPHGHDDGPDALRMAFDVMSTLEN